MADLSAKGRKLIDLAMANDEPPPVDGSWGMIVSRLTIEATGEVLSQSAAPTAMRPRSVVLVLATVVAIVVAWWWSQRPEPAALGEAQPSAIDPAPRTATASSVPDAPAPIVAHELPVRELLPAAEAALAAADPDRAMALLQQHAARAPTDSAAPHRMALRVSVLCAKGDRERARDEAKAFLAAHRDSQWSESVRRSCAAP